MNLKSLIGHIVLLACCVVGLIWAYNNLNPHSDILSKVDMSLTNLKVGFQVYWQKCNTEINCTQPRCITPTATMGVTVVTVNGQPQPQYYIKYTDYGSSGCTGNGTYKICGSSLFCTLTPCENNKGKCGYIEDPYAELSNSSPPSLSLTCWISPYNCEGGCD
jgi:hypothetical protein